MSRKESIILVQFCDNVDDNGNQDMHRGSQFFSKTHALGEGLFFSFGEILQKGKKLKQNACENLFKYKK